MQKDDTHILQSPLMTVKEILKATKSNLLNDNATTQNIGFFYVTTDSRATKKGSLFVALSGEKTDGHNFILDALKSGAAVILLQQEHTKDVEKFLPEYHLSAFITVSNTLKALQEIAEHYLAKFPDLLKIGVTGSSGKTTTRRLLASVLSKKYNLVQTRGNFNSDIGLSLCCFDVKKEHKAAVFEMGMNRKGEMAELSKIFKPQIALITNIGTAHIGILGNREAIANEKKHIFDYFSKNCIQVLPQEDDFCDFLASGIEGKKLFYSKKETKDDKIHFIKDCGLLGTDFSLCNVPIHLSLSGTYNYLDAKAVCLLALDLGLTVQQIKEGIQEVTQEAGRGQVIKGKYTIIDDCYNANPASMAQSIEFFAGVKEIKQKFFVLGDMLELGALEQKEHKKIIQLIAHLLIAKSITKVYYVGECFYNAFCIDKDTKNASKSTLKKNQLCFEKNSTQVLDKIAQDIKQNALAGDMVFLKGSHGIALQRLIDLLKD